jgi:hypothetical protein
MSGDVSSTEINGFRIGVERLPDKKWETAAKDLGLPDSARSEFEKIVSMYQFRKVMRKRVIEARRLNKLELGALRIESKIVSELERSGRPSDRPRIDAFHIKWKRAQEYQASLQESVTFLRNRKAGAERQFVRELVELIARKNVRPTRPKWPPIIHLACKGIGLDITQSTVEEGMKAARNRKRKVLKNHDISDC